MKIKARHLRYLFLEVVRQQKYLQKYLIGCGIPILQQIKRGPYPSFTALVRNLFYIQG